MRLGIDVGKARIGVARSDPHGLLATPVETVARDRRGDRDLERIVEILAEIADFGATAIEVVVGLPLNLRGERTPSTDDAVAFAERLRERLALPGTPGMPGTPSISVRLVDERLSTVSAQGQLRQTGKTSRNSRSVIDQAAAVVILQQALDLERASGEAPGTAVGGASE